MFTEKRIRYLGKKAIEKYGLEYQKLMVIEESAELTKALIKNNRYSIYDGKDTKINVAEEIADVYITITSIVDALNIRDMVKENVNKKLDRLEIRIKE